MSRNPFQQLYVGEKVDPSEFVDIFSYELVPHAMQLFQPGHVILSGVQGSGKSMLFKLLQPEVRQAYASEGKDLPIHKDNLRFIGAGININQSRCRDFGKRRPLAGDNMQELMFGDFFNYVVVMDIIRSVRMLSSEPKIVTDLGLRWDSRRVEALVRNIAEDDVWEGYLNSCTDLDSLQSRIQQRIASYRRYMNGNDQKLADEVFSTKTSAGEPMKVVVRSLKKLDIVPKDVEFFILVDQYEELATIKGSPDETSDYRSVVNSLIDRDPTLSYRLGTRGYAWRNHLNVFGSDGRLEEDRDFKLIDLDAKLRSAEYRGTSVYPDLARDVFERRLRHSMRSGYSRARATKLQDALGKSPLPSDQARELSGNNPASVVKSEAEWPPKIKQLLTNLAAHDPLSAKLGEAWIRQKGFEEIDEGQVPPWELKSKQYWRKERVELALLQIASLKQQRTILYGEADVLGLSGGNILLFLSICQHIWDSVSQANIGNDARTDFPIKGQLQTIGIFRAAKAWLDRVPSDYGRSDDRYKLVQLLGEKFSIALYSDSKMSNPGHSGISLSVEELRGNPEIFDFLIEAVDYGNLVMVEHATRNKDRKRRYKFYLNPLYCPVYRIPFQRSKEPMYLSIDRLKEWLADAKIIDRLGQPRTRRSPRAAASTPLLDLLEHSGE